jgi:hypothetical protein
VEEDLIEDEDFNGGEECLGGEDYLIATLRFYNSLGILSNLTENYQNSLLLFAPIVGISQSSISSFICYNCSYVSKTSVNSVLTVFL